MTATPEEDELERLHNQRVDNVRLSCTPVFKVRIPPQGIDIEREAEKIALNNIPSSHLAHEWGLAREMLKTEIVNLCLKIAKEFKGDLRGSK